MTINSKAYIETYLKIRAKDTSILPLQLNEPQMKLYNALAEQHRQGKPQRAIVLKARQMGFSTLVEALIFKKTATSYNTNSGIVAHEIKATNNLFNIFKRYYTNLPCELQPVLKASNAKELIFDNDVGSGLNSSIKCMTAGNTNIGRSDTFQNLHISEYAFWTGDKADTLLGLIQAVPNLPNTMIVIESTANGYDDFKELWDAAVAGESDFAPVFCAWHELKEYGMAYNGFALTAEEEELKTAYDLDAEQLAWRRWCIKNNCGGKLDKFKQEYPSCPEEAFLMSGRPVFDTEIIVNRIAQLKKQYRETPYKEGYFAFQWNDPDTHDYIRKESLRFIEDKNRRDIKIYEPALTLHPYVLGGDTKGEGKDFFAGTVIDNHTGKRVASLHMDLSESKPFTYQMYCLGVYYNTALIAIESNFNTAPIEELQRLRYPKQYTRRKYDNYTKAIEKKYGFKTDGNTRPLIIDKEIDVIHHQIEQINDISTLQECLTFIYNEKGRPDAMEGKHDDLLFSEMIANEARQQQRYEIARPVKPKRKYTKDMRDDWEAASPKERARLMELWGEPE